MNGKVCHRLRSIARTKAHSWKDTTTKGVKATKIPEIRLGMITDNILNIQNGIFFQRKLDPMSVGAIVKKLKRLHRSNNHLEKKDIFSFFEYVIEYLPNTLGMPSPAK